MSRLATALIVLVAIGLAVFVGTTTRWRFSPDRLNTVGSPLFRFDPAEIHGIKIKNGDTTFTLEQSGEGWRVSNGNEDEASPHMVRALMQAALESPILDRIDASEIEDDKKLSTFGVSKSSLQIDFLGDRPGTLLLGNTNPDGTRAYVSFKNSNTVYLVPKSFAEAVSTDPAAFRERRLLTVDPATIEEITIRSGPSVIALKRNGSTWRILKPVLDHANPAAVESLLETLSQSAIQSFTGKTTPNRNAGEALDFAGSIELRSSAADAPLIITLTRPNESGMRTVELQPRNVSGLLAPNAPDLLAIDLNSLRDRSLARINPDMIDVIKINTPNNKLIIAREGESWALSPIVVDDLVQALASTRVSSYRAATPSAITELGLDNPVYRIEFAAILSENTPEALAGEHSVFSLSIGAPQPDGTLPVLISDSPEIRFVPATLLDTLGNL